MGPAFVALLVSARRAWRTGAVALLALLLAAPALADAPGRVGRLASLSGDVWLFDPDQREWVQAPLNRPLTSGDRLTTDRNGRAELQIGSGTLRMDGSTELDLQEVSDDRVRVELLRGSVALRLRVNDFAREFEIVTSDGRVQPLRDGHYRVDREGDSTVLAAWLGSARFEARDSALEVHDGQRAEFWREGGTTHYTWTQAARDGFTEWALAQDREDDRYYARRLPVPPEMTGGYDLDRYGRWDQHPDYGAVWYPTTVVAGWAPYRYGRWTWVQPWGWTWVDDAPWGFAPFHYGRWVYWGARWAWVPGAYTARPVYAPALVAWIGGSNVSIGISVGAGAPYVGWVPLAPRELYVPRYPVRRDHWRYVNPWHERNVRPVPTGPVMYSNRGVPNGVTVVPSNVLRERQSISPAIVSRVDPRVVHQVAESPRASEPPPRVVPVPGGGTRAAGPQGRGPEQRPGEPARGARTPAVRDGDDGPRGQRPERPAPNERREQSGARGVPAPGQEGRPQAAPQPQGVPQAAPQAAPRTAPQPQVAVPQPGPPPVVVPAPRGPGGRPEARPEPERPQQRGPEGRPEGRGDEGRGRGNEGRGDEGRGGGNESRGNARERGAVQ